MMGSLWLRVFSTMQLLQYFSSLSGFVDLLLGHFKFAKRFITSCDLQYPTLGFKCNRNMVKSQNRNAAGGSVWCTITWELCSRRLYSTTCMMSQYPSGSYETQFESQSGDEENLYNVERILAEKGRKYLVQWEGTDPTTGQRWPPDWVPKTDCTNDLIADWKREKAKMKRGQRSVSIKSTCKFITRPYF